MVRMSGLSDALTSIKHAEKAGKKQVIVRPCSKVIIAFLKTMQKSGYIGSFTTIDTKRQGKIVVTLNGRLNNCGVVTPRYDVGLPQIEHWIGQLLPSRQFGKVVLTTHKGILDHVDCRTKLIGGKILGFFY